MGRKANVRPIEVNADATPITYENVSDYLTQGKTGEISPRIVEESGAARKQQS